jgi:DNA-binding beta-propeller fold protein YncE
VLPVLGALEEKRKDDPVVVIGVHSAKFTAEGDADRIAEAMARHGVRHPVVVDEGHRIWRAYAVRSWPTLVLVRPDGTIGAMASGEADLGPLDAAVGRLLEEARADGTLTRKRIGIDAPPAAVAGPLRFPSRVIALPGGRLAVSDSGHHRVLVLDASGRAETVVGSGEPGLCDGPLETARLRHPQGLAWDADAGLLFVADTGNHALREVSLERRRVRTIAGTGALGRGMPTAAVPATEMPLRSPWDVAVAGDFLLVAMAGTHQVWALNRAAETIGVLAGSGREAIDDGPLATSTFAQPSGLALAFPRLYVVDSETSAVRCLDLARGEVRTLAGKGLFDFGDADGPRGQALLQHPQAVAHGPAGLLVADTYNGKIRSVDEETGEVRTVFVGDGETALREPSGLCQLPDGRVVVADTNHHRLVEISPGGAARVLPVAVTPPPSGSTGVPGDPAGPRWLPRALVGVGDLTLRVRLEPPPGFDLAEGSRVSVALAAEGPLAVPAGDVGFDVTGARRAVPVLATTQGTGEATLDVAIDAVVCGRGATEACWPVEGRWRLPVTVGGGGPVLDLTLRLPAPHGTSLAGPDPGRNR